MKYNKYSNKKTEVDGIKFDSKKEAKRYGELKMLERAGEIKGLELQVRFDFNVNGINLGFYKADFVYDTKEGKPVIEDVKSEVTRKLPVYRIKKKLMLACLGLNITEV